MAEIITQDGEVLESNALADPLAIGLTRAEIDTQISTARKFPRSIDRATKDILTLATMDEETAAECNYALPRAGKAIQGPSIRLSEIIQQCWGNNRVAARVVHVDRAEKYIEAEGVYHDLQTNSATLARVRRRIVDSKGRLYNDDMIITTGNAASSIARRNAILGGVPKSVWRQAYMAALSVVAGDVKTLSARREDAVKAFAHFGVKPEQVFEALAISGVDDITLNHIPILRGMFAALKNGEATVEEMFSGKRGNAPSHEVVKNPLADDAGDEKGAPTGKGAPEAATDGGEPPPMDASVAAANLDFDPNVGVVPAKNWHKEGVKAGLRGMSLRAIPAGLQASGMDAQADEWRAGHAEGVEQRKAKEAAK